MTCVGPIAVSDRRRSKDGEDVLGWNWLVRNCLLAGEIRRSSRGMLLAMAEIRCSLGGKPVFLIAAFLFVWLMSGPNALAGQGNEPKATSDVGMFRTSPSPRTLVIGPRTPVNPPIVGYHGETMVAADPESSNDLIVCGFRSNERTGAAYEGYVYHSGDAGKTWREVLVDANSQWISEESCAFGPGHQAYFAAGDSDTSMGEPHHEYGNLHLYRSNDGGRTWQTILLNRFLDWTSMAVDATHSPWRNTVYMFASTVVDGTDRSIDTTSPSATSSALPLGWAALAKAPYLATFRERPQLSFSVTSGSFNAGDSGSEFRGKFSRGAAVLSDGTALALFVGDREIVDKKSKSKTRIYSIELGTSRDGGNSLSKTVLYEDVNRQIATGLAVNPATDEIYVGWMPERADLAKNQFTIATSRDGGRSWNVGPVKVPPGSALDILPGSLSLAANRDGALGFMWYGKKATQVYFAVSFDAGASVSNVVQLTTDLPASPAQPLQYADDRRVDVYPPAWNLLSQWPNPLKILTFGPTRLGVPFGVALVADATGAFHPVWSEVANGPTNLWTRTISFEMPAQSRVLPTVEGLTDVSDRVASHITNIRFDHLENLIAFDLTVSNKSDAPVGVPILAAVTDSTKNLEISSYNADNGKGAGMSLWELQVSGDALASEHDTEPRTLSFRLDSTPDDQTHYSPVDLLVRIYGKLR
jgi:hypothetical protein